jgi:putative transposon-encoded protein
MPHEKETFSMATVKTIGSSGQIALGKEYAGRHVLVDEVERGVWVVKLGDFVPDSERWLHRPDVSRTLDRAVAWAEKHPPRKSSLAGLAKRLGK